jgi:hypothetical protein
MERPMPRPAPVTIAVLPESSPAISQHYDMRVILQLHFGMLALAEWATGYLTRARA